MKGQGKKPTGSEPAPCFAVSSKEALPLFVSVQGLAQVALSLPFP